MQVSGAGLCGSDLHCYLEGGAGAAAIREPFVPGHELAGWSLEERPYIGVSKGQLPAMDPAEACRVDVDGIVAHHCPLDESPRGFKAQAEHVDGALRSIIVPGLEAS